MRRRADAVMQELERKLKELCGANRIEPAVKALLNPQPRQRRVAREMWGIFSVPGSFELYCRWLMFNRPALFVRLVCDTVLRLQRVR